MCVIAVSPVGVGIPTEDNMKEMFRSNSDGAGFAYAVDKRVYIEKGFMTYQDFERAWALVEKKLKKRGKEIEDIGVMFHFRIGTHGPNSEGLTHPFPISDSFKHLSALDLYSSVAVAHNGIINSVTPRTGWSDTQQYIADVITPLYRHDYDCFKSPEIQDLVENTISGSRFVFLDKYGDFTLVGDWKDSTDTKLKGIKYSNLNHEYYGGYYSSAYRGGWGSYYDDDEYYIDVSNIWVAPLPKGTLLARDKDMDANFEPINKKGLDVVGKDERLYVDYKGDLYRVLDAKESGYRTLIYDYALRYDEDNDLYSYLTTQDFQDKDCMLLEIEEYKIIPKGVVKSDDLPDF